MTGPPLRVLHVVEAVVAGNKRHVVALADEQRRQGHDVLVASPRQRHMHDMRETDFVDQLEAHGVAWTELPLRREVGPRDAAAVGRVVALARRFGADVIHGHSSKGGAVGRLAGTLTRAARVYTANGFAFLGEERGVSAYGLAERALVPFTDLFVAVSDEEVALASERLHMSPEQVLLCRNVLPVTPHLSPRPGGRFEDRVTIVAAGRLVPQKGFDILLSAFAQVARSDARLRVFGDGPDGQALRDQSARLGITDQVEFAGYSEDMPGVLHDCDVVIMPSRYEGLPYLALEAMAAGRPVIATRACNLPGTLEDGVLAHVPTADVGALADALRQLPGPAELRRVGEAAREAVCRMPDAASWAQAVTRGYHTALARRAGKEVRVTCEGEGESA
jgi:glycosyltransferase involved in cell wall biosynthesis